MKGEIQQRISDVELHSTCFFFFTRARLMQEQVENDSQVAGQHLGTTDKGIVNRNGRERRGGNTEMR